MPTPEGCETTNSSTPENTTAPTIPADCPVQRGVGLYKNHQSAGFDGKDSKTYVDNVEFPGFSLGADLSLGDIFGERFGKSYTVSGAAGLDYISMYPVDGNGAITPKQRVPILGDSSLNFFSPIVGLGFGNWSSKAHWALSLMSSLATNLTIPSRSWGYTAGASYRQSRKSLLSE